MISKDKYNIKKVKVLFDFILYIIRISFINFIIIIYNLI